MTDTAAANAAYQTALTAAQAELDVLLPEFQRVKARVNHLKSLCTHASALIGVEVPDKYVFTSAAAVYGAYVAQHGTKEGRTIRG